ncbi:DNA helicase [Malassezia cuniculi]|uniref:DNA 3'-5' helicase n=1 Tax=Malassezia cuniculi TaxID=948313 RepID=A0AAF0EQT7_9BASI|nr:DNA helicase [Malassezia cuniculi]
MESAIVASHGDALPPLKDTLVFLVSFIMGRVDAYAVFRFEFGPAIELLYWCRTFLAVARISRELTPQSMHFHHMILTLDADCRRALDAVYSVPVAPHHSGLTSEQAVFVAHDVKKGDLVRVQAFAGTGKTRSLLAYAEKRPHLRFLYLAFNAATAQSARSQFPRHVACRTLHSVALHGATLADGQELGTIRARDVVRILRGRLPQGNSRKSDGPPEQLSSSTAAAYVLKTLERFMQSDDPHIRQVHIPKALTQHTDLEPHAVADAASALWDAICTGKTASGKLVPCPHDAYMKIAQLAGSVAFFEPYDAVLVDEAQDLSRCQTALVMQARRHCGVIFVGDVHQKIYAFRGGSAAAFDARLYPPSASFELTRSFRFGDGVAEIASTILGLKADQRPRLHGTGTAHVFRTQHRAPAMPLRTSATLALAVPHTRIYRTNVRLALDALQLAATLPMAKRLYLKTSQNMQQSALISLLRDAHALFHGKRPSSMPLRDFGAWKELVEHVQAEEGGGDSKLGLAVSLSPLLEQSDFLEQVCRLETRFCDKEEDALVVMSTVHQAKGLEWDRVVLADDFSPLYESSVPMLHPQVTLWFAQDELNHMYVAITRARSELVLPDGIMRWIAALNGLFRYRLTEKGKEKCPKCGAKTCMVQLCQPYAPRDMCAVSQEVSRAAFDACVTTLGCLGCLRSMLADDEDLEDFVRWVDSCGVSATTGILSHAAVGRTIKKYSERPHKRSSIAPPPEPLTTEAYSQHLANRRDCVSVWFALERHWRGQMC